MYGNLKIQDSCKDQLHSIYLKLINFQYKLLQKVCANNCEKFEIISAQYLYNYICVTINKEMHMIPKIKLSQN